jgi:hypothetical protein
MVVLAMSQRILAGAGIKATYGRKQGNGGTQALES